MCVHMCCFRVRFLEYLLQCLKWICRLLHFKPKQGHAASRGAWVLAAAEEPGEGDPERGMAGQVSRRSPSVGAWGGVQRTHGCMAATRNQSKAVTHSKLSTIMRRIQNTFHMQLSANLSEQQMDTCLVTMSDRLKL